MWLRLQVANDSEVGAGRLTLNNPIKRPHLPDIRNFNDLESVAVVVRPQGVLQCVDNGRSAGAHGAADGETGAEEGRGCVCRNVAVDARDEDDMPDCGHGFLQ